MSMYSNRLQPAL